MSGERLSEEQISANVERARQQLERMGYRPPLHRLEEVSGGVCPDCELERALTTKLEPIEHSERYRIGRNAFCRDHAEVRVRIQDELTSEETL